MGQSSLAVRWNIRNGFFVQDLFVVECEVLQDVMAVVSEGHRNRRIGSHELNKDSSRSHSILTVHLESETIDPDDGHPLVKFGKIVFVDLAGSERLKDTRSEGMTLTETGAINRSLFTLSKVISALADAAKKKKPKKSNFVPYRDSKLTKLLMDSLGGTSMTLMIACVSPSSHYMDETISTLNYATRANKIQNKPMVQMDPKEQLIYNLRQEIKLLRMENNYLRQQLALHGGPAVPCSPALAGSLPVSRSSASSSGMHYPPHHSPNSRSSCHAGTPSGSHFPAAGSAQSARSPHRSGPPLSSPPPGLPPASPGLSSRDGVSLGSAPPGLPTPGSRHNGGRMSPRISSNHPDAGGGPGLDHRGHNSRGTSRGSAVERDARSAASERERDQRFADMLTMLEEYQREVERLKKENRDVRAKGSVAERGYRAVMEENERLCNKLEHLEEIFVHQSRQTPWPRVREDKGADSDDDSDGSGNRAKASIRRLKAENDSLQKRLKMMEHALPQRFGDVGEGLDQAMGSHGAHRQSSEEVDKKEQRDTFQLRQLNMRLQRRVESLQKREMELLRIMGAKSKQYGGSVVKRNSAHSEGKK